ncbi:MAG: NAD-dependent epimerase/dehydratase family protein [Actinomycetota bacterium]
MKGRRVLVTGMGGELGSLVASRVEASEWAGDILGFDVDPPRRLLRRARFVRVAPHERDRIADLIEEFNPHVILHIGVWEPHARLATEQAAECTETIAKAVFDAAHRAEALETAVVRSGIEIYGAATHSPRIAVETTPVAPTTTYGRMCATIEDQATELRTAAGVNVCTLRLAPVLGAHVPSPLGRLMRLPMVPYHGVRNPVFCVVEDHDAAPAFLAAAARDADGTVNIVANGAISMLRATTMGRRIPVPSFGPGWSIARSATGIAGAPMPDHVADLIENGRLAASNEAAHLLRFAAAHTTTEVIERLYMWPSVERIPARVQVA